MYQNLNSCAGARGKRRIEFCESCTLNPFLSGCGSGRSRGPTSRSGGHVVGAAGEVRAAILGHTVGAVGEVGAALLGHVVGAEVDA